MSSISTNSLQRQARKNRGLAFTDNIIETIINKSEEVKELKKNKEKELE
jgi:phosphopantothenate synthetase